MSDEKLVEKVEAAPVAAKKEDKKVAAAVASTPKKEEIKSVDCQEKLDKLIAALLQSHPAVAKQIKLAGLGE
jgi:hypothetical protein